MENPELSIWLPEERLFLIDKNNEKIAVNTKLLSSVLLPSMLLGAAQVFAPKQGLTIVTKQDSICCPIFTKNKFISKSSCFLESNHV
mgnify:CR=1 FL=1